MLARFAALGSLCDSCRAEWLAWLSYRQPRTIQLAAGAAYDSTPAGVADRQHARFESWRDTIVYQQTRIEQICADRHHPQGADQCQT